MEQLSLFDNEVSFPCSHDDIMSLYNKYIYEGEQDPDVFTFSDTKKGRSYFFYNEKVFEHKPGDLKTARLYVAVVNENGEKKFVTKKPSDLPADELVCYLLDLKKKKQEIFSSLVIDQFGCCNDFMACSDAGHCLHAEDRFYNGCLYRVNLEAGKIFYGINRNV